MTLVVLGATAAVSLLLFVAWLVLARGADEVGVRLARAAYDSVEEPGDRSTCLSASSGSSSSQGARLVTILVDSRGPR